MHLSSQTVENVRSFAERKRHDYPVVVDNDAGEIAEVYRQAGVVGFPSYLLLGPDGRIIHNDAISEFPSLRLFKAEIIWVVLRS